MGLKQFNSQLSAERSAVREGKGRERGSCKGKGAASSSLGGNLTTAHTSLPLCLICSSGLGTSSSASQFNTVCVCVCEP